MLNVKCSIVIRTFNEEKHVGKLLQGIYQQTIEDVEVIIVDSGSSDRTVAIASQYPIKLVQIEPEEFSFGRALNRGCGVATGEYIVMASAHVYPLYNDWLEKLIEPFKLDQTALVYGKQQGDESTKYSEHQVFAQWFGEQPCLAQAHPFCNNANAAIRRSLWQQYPYDEQLTGLEDIDWARRVQAKGWNIAYVPEATIVHVHQESWQQIFNRYRREAIALKRIFPEEQFRWWDLIALLVGNVMSDYYHAWHDGVLGKNIRAIFLFRLMQFWGTYRGWGDRVSHQLKQTFYYPKGFVRSSTTTKSTSQRPIDYQQATVYSKQ